MAESWGDPQNHKMNKGSNIELRVEDSSVLEIMRPFIPTYLRNLDTRRCLK